MQIGVDIGGTFTDIVALDRDGTLALTKVPSERGTGGRAVSARPKYVGPPVKRIAEGGTVRAVAAVAEKVGRAR